MAPTLNVQFFIEGKDYGRGKMAYFPTEGTSDVQWNRAFSCQLCGRQWAQALITDTKYPAQWAFTNAVCLNHSISYSVCGSIWKPGHADLIQAFTPEILERELELHLSYYEKFGHSLY